MSVTDPDLSGVGYQVTGVPYASAGVVGWWWRGPTPAKEGEMKLTYTIEVDTDRRGTPIRVANPEYHTDRSFETLDQAVQYLRNQLVSAARRATAESTRLQRSLERTLDAIADAS